MYNELILSKYDLSEKEIKDFVACTNSYLGIMKHYDTYRLRKKMLKSVDANCWKYVSCGENFEKIELFDD